MPNVENITKLQELIAGQPHVELEADSGFNMLHVHHPCGTPSCIAGFRMTISGGEEPEHFLGLSPDQYVELICPGSNNETIFNWNSITPAQAVEALEKLKSDCSISEIWSHLDEK